MNKNISNDFSEIINDIKVLENSVKNIAKKIKNLKKNSIVSIKEIEKSSKLKYGKYRRIKNKNSGFAQPLEVSNKLAHFLNIPENTKIPRTQVTKEINKYITEKELKDPENKKIIIPDEKLNELLQIDDNESLTFFTLQKKLNPHFVSCKK